MGGVSFSLYKRFRRREAQKREQACKELESQKRVLVVDPSFELFHHQQTIHDEFHRGHPSPDCAICGSNGSLRSADSVASRFSHCSSPRRGGSGRLSHSPSIASSNSSSGYAGTYSAYDSVPDSPFEVRSSDTMLSLPPANEQAYTRSAFDLHQPQSPQLPRLTTHLNASLHELETPPSYDFAVSTSPRSTRCNDFLPRATLNTPFSVDDPLEALEELPADCIENERRSPTARTNSNSSWSGYGEARNPLEQHSHHNNLAPIAESELQDLGLGHRDDLIKQGFML